MYGETRINKNQIYVVLHGSVDTSVTTAFHDLMVGLPVESAASVVIDVGDVPFISASGIHELLVLQTRFSGGRICLQNANFNILQALSSVGFNTLFDIKFSSEIDVNYTIYSFKDFLRTKLLHQSQTVILNDGFQKWTWSDLDHISDVIASDLIHLGAKKGSHIAICGANSLNWVATFFAIQKLGAVAVAINPLLSPYEIGDIIAYSDIQILCHGIGPWLSMDGSGAFVNTIESFQTGCLFYNIFDSIDVSCRSVSLVERNFIDSVHVMSDDPCMMFFTSGSTGAPKGVVLSARTILMAAMCGGSSFPESDHDVLCLALPLFHVFGFIAALVHAILKDICVVVVSRIKPDIIAKAMAGFGCTYTCAVPTLMMGLASLGSECVQQLSSLKFVVLGGAPILKDQLIYLHTCFPQVLFNVVYGLSEVPLVSILPKRDSLDRAAETVGVVTDYSDVQIEDPNDFHLCKTGEVGEIVCKGSFVMVGYYKTPMDQQGIDAQGWFHTGDMGYLDENGYLHFVDRQKNVIIRGGENIFPNHIAKVVLAYDPIVNTQIFGIPDDYYGEIVGCAIILQSGAEFDEAVFRTYLSNQLAVHEVPAFIAVYDQFPLLASGKVDVLTLRQDMQQKMNAKLGG